MRCPPSTPRRGIGLFALPLFLLLVAVPVDGQQRGLTPEDSYRMASVGSPEISPTGEYVAFTVTTVDEEDNSRNTTIWLQELSDGQPVGDPIRFTDPTRNSSSPQWSPDGRLLSFTSRRGDEEGSIWFLRVGAPGGEAFQIEGVDSRPIWSPDGSRIAMVKEPERDEEPSRQERRIAPVAITTGLDARHFDGHVVTHRRYKSDGTREWLPHPDHSLKNQIFVVSASGGEPEQVSEVPFSARQVSWSPDGSFFVFTMNEHEDEEYSFDPTSAIYAMPAGGGDARKIVELPGGQSSPAVSPDGRYLAFNHVPDWNAETELAVVEIGPDGTARGEPRILTGEWNRTATSPRWTPDGGAIRWEALSSANTHVFQVAPTGGPVRQVTRGDRTLSGVSETADGRLMAYTSTDPALPADVYVSSADGSREVRLTSFNDELLAEVQLQPAELITWTVADGTEVEGWVIPPVEHEAGQSYPLVMSIHGGPHSAYRNSFSHLFQVMAGSGFYLFYVNPRGSTGYGNDFKHAIHAGWGLVDEEDFVEGVRAVLAAYPDVDPDRLGVMGGCYGGYMTNWLTARTDLFAAAVTRASISHWESLAKTTDSNLPHMPFDGPSYEQRELYRALSPISYVEGVTTPTLIIHGENDYRTPLGEGEQWYQALKKLGVPVEFVLYPRSAHGIREPWLAADSQERTRQWMTHWLIERAEGVRVDGQVDGEVDGTP